MPKLRIAEIFSSIQGEGMWVGVPSTFVRISGCNLRCCWCDTPYASWNPEGPLREVDDLVQEVLATGTRHVVITGGEPMLFEGVIPLARALDSVGRTITIETAGTVWRHLPCHLMSISPKLSHSAPDESTGWRERHDELRLNIPVLQLLASSYPYQLKFVVNPETGDDFAEILELLQYLPTVEPDRVMLMPEGRDAETIWRRARQLVEPCQRKGWRLSPRLQIDLFGDRRGT